MSETINSDETRVGGKTWKAWRKKAMQHNYESLDEVVSNKAFLTLNILIGLPQQRREGEAGRAQEAVTVIRKHVPLEETAPQYWALL